MVSQWTLTSQLAGAQLAVLSPQSVHQCVSRQQLLSQLSDLCPQTTDTRPLGSVGRQQVTTPHSTGPLDEVVHQAVVHLVQAARSDAQTGEITGTETADAVGRQVAHGEVANRLEVHRTVRPKSAAGRHSVEVSVRVGVLQGGVPDTVLSLRLVGFRLGSVLAIRADRIQLFEARIEDEVVGEIVVGKELSQSVSTAAGGTQLHSDGVVWTDLTVLFDTLW